MKGMEKVVEAMQPAVRSPQQREPGTRRGLRARDAEACLSLFARKSLASSPGWRWLSRTDPYRRLLMVR